MIAIVTGGRLIPPFGLKEKHWLNKKKLQLGFNMLYWGGAKGADTWTYLWSCEVGLPSTEFKADWDKYGKRAGFVRNVTMRDVALKHDNEVVLLAFPGGVGTKMMVALANDAGILVREFTCGEPRP